MNGLGGFVVEMLICFFRSLGLVLNIEVIKILILVFWLICLGVRLVDWLN